MSIHRRISWLIGSIILASSLLLVVLLISQQTMFAEPLASPVLVSTDPDKNAVGAGRDTAVTLTFDQPIKANSVNSQTFVVQAMQTGLINGAYGAAGNTVIFTPTAPFKPGEFVQVSVVTDMMNLLDAPLGEAAVFQFSAASNPASGVFTRTYAITTPFLDFPPGALIAMGDLDDDGDLDLFISYFGFFPYDGAHRVYLNYGRGVFIDSGQRLGNEQGRKPYLFDVDNDGDLDAVAYGSISEQNKIWFNDGTGKFQNIGETAGNSGQSFSVVGDLNGDAHLDGILHDLASNAYNVWLNDGAGNFADYNEAVGFTDSRNPTLGDLDLDGDLDLFIPGAVSSTVWLNDGAGRFSYDGLSYEAVTAAETGDLDGDGDLDLVLTNTEPDNPIPDEVWLNDGGFQGGALGQFTNTGQALGNDTTSSVTLADVDGDGDLDAFTTGSCCPGTAVNSLYINDGSGNFTEAAQFLGSLSVTPQFGDLDGDGDGDLVLGSLYYNSNDIEVWLNDYDIEGVTSIAGLSVSDDMTLLPGATASLTATVTAGDDVIYAWDLGDGSLAEGPDVTHTYNVVGSYTATVRAINPKSVVSGTVEITVVAPYQLYLPVVNQAP